MNLHILTDSSIAATFVRNLKELGLSDNNKFIVRGQNRNTKYMRGEMQALPLYSAEFDAAVGDTKSYEKVFIHQFSPLMYRWVAKNNFNELNWMVWGADLYNLSGIGFDFYEALTRKYINRTFSFRELLFNAKIFFTNRYFRKPAFAKVSSIYTWMETEYQFAIQHLAGITAGKQFFYYENDVPYHQLDSFRKEAKRPEPGRQRRLLVGNSGTPTNNHLDSIARLEQASVKADLILPVSYGDEAYIRYLKENLPSYTGGSIEFVERFMPFDEYMRFLLDSDGMIINTIRPQGYGNILMLLYLGKPIYLNEKNTSISDLARLGIQVNPWYELTTEASMENTETNKAAIQAGFSHERLGKMYKKLFGENSQTC